MPTKDAPEYRRTKDTATTKELRKLFGFTLPKKLRIIGVCSGEWRKRRDGDWQFYELADLH